MKLLNQFSKFSLFLVAIFFSMATIRAQRPPNKVTAGKSLVWGSTIESSLGAYYVVLYDQGEIIIKARDIINEKPQNTYTNVWSMKVGGVKLKVQDDGNLVAYEYNDKAVWSTGTNGRGGSGTHLQIQQDGNLVLYNGTWTGLGDGDALWATGTCGGVVNGCGSVGTR